MKALVSPAKSLELIKQFPLFPTTTPIFLETTLQLNIELAALCKSEIANLMNISDKLADLNYSRFQDFQITHTSSNSRPAIFTFNGDVYDGIDAFSIDASKYKALQSSLRILSGFYGVLKPFDLMQPYRLEMGTKIEIGTATNLYELWKDKITNSLNREISKNELIVNLASQEYFKAVNEKELNGKLVSPVFKDFKNGKLKIISFYAKKARGLMFRYLLDHSVKNIDDLLKFNYEGYRFSEDETKNFNSPVFVR